MSGILFLPFITWQINFGILTSVLKPVTPNIIQDTVPGAVNSKQWVLHKLLAVDLNWGDFYFLSGWWWFHYIFNGALCCLFQRWWQVQSISHTVPNRADSSDDDRHKKTMPKVYPNEIKKSRIFVISPYTHIPLRTSYAKHYFVVTWKPAAMLLTEHMPEDHFANVNGLGRENEKFIWRKRQMSLTRFFSPS